MIFETKENGKIKFVGDFDAFYRDNDDAWQQSGEHGSMGEFYRLSRICLNSLILNSIETQLVSKKCSLDIAEVGCGTGYSTKLLNEFFSDSTVYGLDISELAINKAKNNFPEIYFDKHDILLAPTKRKFDVIILSNLIWYVLHSFDDLLEHSVRSLNSDGGLVIFHNSFFKTGQKYAVDKVQEIEDVLKLCQTKLSDLIASYTCCTTRWDPVLYDFGYCAIYIKAGNE